MNCRCFLAILSAVALTIPAVTVSAQEMTFEPDEVEEEESGGAEEEESGDDGEMTFAPDDLEDEDFDPDEDMEEQMDVGIVAIPGEDISEGERDELQEVLEGAADDVPEIVTYGDTDLLPALQERGPEYCSRESLCLGSIGESAGVERILQGRVEEVDGQYRLDIDYFDVQDRLFVAYYSDSGLGSFGDVIEAVSPGIDDIFDIRRDEEGDSFVDDRDVDVQGVMAYSTAGASVASLATGILFGLQASSQQSEIESARDDDGRFSETTQVEVRDMQRSMENSALTANVFYGLSAGLAAVSIALFAFGGEEQSEATADYDDSTWYGDIEVAPRIGGDRVGVGARFDF